MYKALLKNKKFVFNKLFTVKERSREEVVTAFSGVLELSRRNKINAEQKEVFGEIILSRGKENATPTEDLPTSDNTQKDVNTQVKPKKNKKPKIFCLK